MRRNERRKSRSRRRRRGGERGGERKEEGERSVKIREPLSEVRGTKNMHMFYNSHNSTA